MAEYIQGMFWTAAFAVVGGMVLIFSSTSFGMARGENWGLRQSEMMGGYDPEIQKFIIATASDKFIILGSILFGAGLLLAMATYFYYLLKGNAKEKAIKAIKAYKPIDSSQVEQ